MKYPVIYIKGRGNHTARFTELTEGQMRIAGDIGAAMGKLMPLKDDHAFIPVSYTHLTLPTIYSV